MSDESQRGGLFAIGTDVYVWDDVVRLAKVRGEWAALAEHAGEGAAALTELEARGEELDDHELEVARRRFRYERDLLAADELDEWLERHELTSSDWQTYLRRTAAREQLQDPTPSSPAVTEAEIWCEGICSGSLPALVRELAMLAAVAPETPVESLDAAFAEFCAGAVDASAVAREVDLNRLEWLRCAYEAVIVEDEGAAFEAALSVRADGDTLPAVAERASLPVTEDECWLEELDAALATRFLAATAGEVVGPVAIDGGFVVARVVAKTAPSLDDPAVRARAREAAVDRAVERIVAERVTW